MDIEEYLQDRQANTTSKNTILLVRSALKHFAEFTDPKEAIDRIRKDQEANPLSKTPYIILADFISYMKQKNLSPASIKSYYNATRDFLRANQIFIINEYCKTMVRAPKIQQHDKYALTKQDIRKLLKHSDEKWDALIHAAFTSGIRLGALLSLSPAMLTPLSECVRVEMPKSITKMSKTETAFMSLPAYNKLTQFAGAKNDPILGDKAQHVNERSRAAEWEFSKIRKKAKLTERYENSDRYKIHFHAFRHYFFTRAVEVLKDVDLAHHLTGHEIHLSTYLRHDPKYLERKYVQLVHSGALEV